MAPDDIAAREHAERALKRSEQRVRLIVESATDYAIFLTDPDGVITDWMPGAQAVFGWEPQEVVGRHMALLYTPEDQAEDVPEREIAVARSRGVAPDVRWHVRKSGERVFIDGKVTALYDDNHQLIAMLKIGQDVTVRRAADDLLRKSELVLRRLNEALESKVDARTADLRRAVDALQSEVIERGQAEDALRQAQKMEAVGQLTGGIAHDFNNLLQNISSSLELARWRIARSRPAEAEPFLESAQQSVVRAGALTQRLLAFARRQRLEPRPIDPDALAEGIAELIRRAVGPTIELKLELGDGSWAVRCDPNQLENALLNLAINARDAMPDGGTVVIRTRHVMLDAADVEHQEGALPGEFVEIAVQDSGSGMDERTRSRAFEPFFTTKAFGQGTGLGLSQLYGFVRQSFGTIAIESRPGEGTTVRFCLPRAANDDGAEETRQIVQDLVRMKRGTVLLVEDEQGVREMVAEHLREIGYQVLEAGDGPAALHLIEAEVPACLDLLITDVGLPRGMNGRQVASAVRERHPELPVLIVTGYAGDVLEGVLEPGIEVMGKPFKLESLTTAVERLIDHRGF